MDHLWGKAKTAVAANYQFASVDELAEIHRLGEATLSSPGQAPGWDLVSPILAKSLFQNYVGKSGGKHQTGVGTLP
jgi:hypothetical protein